MFDFHIPPVLLFDTIITLSVSTNYLINYRDYEGWLPSPQEVEVLPALVCHFSSSATDGFSRFKVIHSRKFMMRQGPVVGSFKIDLKTIYDAPGRYKRFQECLFNLYAAFYLFPVRLCLPQTHITHRTRNKNSHVNVRSLLCEGRITRNENSIWITYWTSVISSLTSSLATV